MEDNCKKIIDLAKSQNGIKEFPSGSNKSKYGEWYGLNGYRWCAMFVSWVYSNAGYPLGHIEGKNGYQSCQGGYNHWKATGELTKDPKPGDIVLFDWEVDGHADHTGIFDSWTDGSKTHFLSWEGNTAVGNNSNGGQVMQRMRNVSVVKSFVHPKVLDV